MPVKRRVAKVRSGRITPEVVEWWSVLTEIQDAGADALFEDVGGRRREYFDHRSLLHRALDIPPWEPSPCEIYGPESDWHWNGDQQHNEAWARNWQYRRELDAALRKVKRNGKA